MRGSGRCSRGEGINDAVHVAVYRLVNVDFFFIIAGHGGLRGGEGCRGGTGGRKLRTREYQL